MTLLTAMPSAGIAEFKWTKSEQAMLSCKLDGVALPGPFYIFQTKQANAAYTHHAVQYLPDRSTKLVGVGTFFFQPASRKLRARPPGSGRHQELLYTERLRPKLFRTTLQAALPAAYSLFGYLCLFHVGFFAVRNELFATREQPASDFSFAPEIPIVHQSLQQLFCWIAGPTLHAAKIDSPFSNGRLDAIQMKAVVACQQFGRVLDLLKHSPDADELFEDLRQVSFNKLFAETDDFPVSPAELKKISKKKRLIDGLTIPEFLNLVRRSLDLAETTAWSFETLFAAHSNPILLKAHQSGFDLSEADAQQLLKASTKTDRQIERQRRF